MNPSIKALDAVRLCLQRSRYESLQARHTYLSWHLQPSQQRHFGSMAVGSWPTPTPTTVRGRAIRGLPSSPSYRSRSNRGSASTRSMPGDGPLRGIISAPHEDIPAHTSSTNTTMDPTNTTSLASDGPSEDTTSTSTPASALIPHVHITPVRLSRPALERLHRLSALVPPPEGSPDEAELVEGLADLLGLMEMVKAVDLPPELATSEGRAALLSQGVGEVIMDFGVEDGLDLDVGREGRDPPQRAAGEQDIALAKSGRDLREYATSRVGDYYASGLQQRPEAGRD